MTTFFALAVAGAFAGFAAGLFGIGGGVIIVPALLAALRFDGVPESVAMHLAIGSSLATIVLTAISSVRAHWRLGNIQAGIVPWLGGGLVVGAFTTAQFASAIEGDWLRLGFATFCVAMAVRLTLVGQPATGGHPPARPWIALFGLGVGALSSLVGIGGGAMVVPYLQWCGLEMRRAVGTSAAGGLLIAVAGALGFVLAGRAAGADLPLPAGSSGFVYWPGVASVSLCGVFLAPVGARLASRLPQQRLRQAFAAFLLTVGLLLYAS